jgi:hypothetical protein
MAITPSELAAIKSRITRTLNKRTGVGKVNQYASDSKYALSPTPAPGSPISAQIGKATVDLLLKVVKGNKETGFDFEDKLGRDYTYVGGAIPPGFNTADINSICDALDADTSNTTTKGGFKGTYNGVAYDLPGGNGGKVNNNNKTETNHCGGACTGICVGSCIGMCNGCSGCSASCGTGCASGAMW